MPDNCLDAALAYAARGWHVFPVHTPVGAGACSCGQATCTDIGKHPRTEHGLNDATTNEATIRAWWQRWPHANLGLRTGAVSGFVVLDIDVAGDGEDSLADLEARNDHLPNTVEAITGSGGRHILFAHPGTPIANSVRSLGHGLDVRGDGGYIVAAPSRHRSGRDYCWELSSDPSDTSLAALPDWLLRLIQADRPATTAQLALPTLIEQGRNNALIRFGGILRRRGFSEAEILATLTAVNEARCVPPLGEVEVGKIAKSASRYAPDAAEVTQQQARSEAETLLADLRHLTDPKTAITQALQSETLGALALVAHQDGATFEAILNDLRQNGMTIANVESVRRAVHSQVRKLRQLRLVRGESETIKVIAVLPGAPVPDDAVVPEGWRLGPEGVCRERSSFEEGSERTSSAVIAATPVVIAGRLKDVSDGSELVRLAYLRDHRWQHHTVGRATVANARSIVELAGIGMPITSGSAGEIVDYLAHYESANMTTLPRSQVSRQMGWQGEDGSLGFLWGRTLIRPDGTQSGHLALDSIPVAEWQEDWISYQGDDGGDEQIADGYVALGSLDAWREGIAPVAGYPLVLLSLYASFVPPLLMIFRARNFVIDFSYQTSTGKTTAQRIAASVWGCADERAAAAALTTWDATRVWIERASAALNGLPLILDDTKLARNPKLVAQTIYDVVSGRGRGRGSAKGLRRTSTWQTVLLSSGETPLTSFSEDGGTRTRVLTAWGMPFGKANAETVPVVNRLNLLIKNHYGHGGPAFVQFLLTHREQWPEWREEFVRVQEEYIEKAAGNPVAARLAEPFALLDLAAALSSGALHWPWDYHDPIAGLWESFVNEANESDRASSALEHVVSWAMGHPLEFFGRNPEKRAPSSAGWAGKWDGGPEWEYIAFLPHRLESIIKDFGYDVEATLRLWSDRGWLQKEVDDRHRGIKLRMDGERTRMVAIRRATINEIMGTTDD